MKEEKQYGFKDFLQVMIILFFGAFTFGLVIGLASKITDKIAPWINDLPDSAMVPLGIFFWIISWIVIMIFYIKIDIKNIRDRLNNLKTYDKRKNK